MAEQYNEDKTARHLDHLSEALDSGTQYQVRHLLKNLSASEIGDLLESLPTTKRLAVWEMTDPELEGDVLVEVNDEVRATLIRGTSHDDLVAAVDDLDLDDLADILDDLPNAVISEVLRSMDRQDRERLAQVLSYPEDSAGGLMDPDVITIRPDVTLDVVLRYLRARGELPEVFDLLFVIDRQGRYLGSLKLSDLLTQELSNSVGELMDTSAQTIPVTMHESQVALEFEHHDLVSAPVIDDESRLLGRITVDDVVDVIRDEAEHTVLTMAGLDEEDDMFAPVVQSARKRWVWLGVNLVTALLAAVVLYAFEPTLDQIVATAVLFPVVMSMGGIAGTQTLTLMVRGMATGQVSSGNTPALLRCDGRRHFAQPLGRRAGGCFDSGNTQTHVHRPRSGRWRCVDDGHGCDRHPGIHRSGDICIAGELISQGLITDVPQDRHENSAHHTGTPAAERRSCQRQRGPHAPNQGWT